MMSEALDSRGRVIRAELLRRWAPWALAVFVASALLAGCAATDGGSDDSPLLFPAFLQGLERQAPIAAPRTEAFQRGVFQDVNDERRAEHAAVSAFCNVTAEVADSGQPRPEEAWLDGMRAQVREDNPDDIANLAQGKLDEIQAATPLAEITPKLAARYAQSCEID